MSLSQGFRPNFLGHVPFGQPPPGLPHINHFLVVYSAGSFAVQIAPAICGKGEAQNTLKPGHFAPSLIKGRGWGGFWRRENHSKYVAKPLN